MKDDEVRHLNVSAAAAGVRLDRFLSDRFSLTRGAAGRLIAAGAVTHNGRIGRRGDLLAEGDVLKVDASLLALGDRAQPDPDLGLAVHYEDEDLVVVDKPAGMPSHPLRPGERGTLASALLAHYPEMGEVGRSAREPGLVHRLDIDTSGLLLCARHPRAFTALSAALGAGHIDKQYEAIALGHVEAARLHEGYLSARGATVRIQATPGRGCKPVRTEILASEPCGDHSRVRLRVHTAGRHQIRAHLAHLGHPLYGDVRYGGHTAYDRGGHVLHATSLAFEHPVSGRPVEVRSPAPDRFEICASHLDQRPRA